MSAASERAKTVVGTLVGQATGIRLTSLPASTVSAAKRTLLDALGCGIAAIGCEAAAIVDRVVPRGSEGEATVYGESAPTSLERAVLMNGVLVRYLDMMDVYWANDVCHPSENVPLALACVESVRGSGARLLEAIIAGYEAQTRLAHAMSLESMGMHHVTAAGIVTPLVVGTAWGLPAATIEQAVALNGCRQFTLHSLSKGRLSMAKCIGYPWSAMQSIMATRLAREGFTGPVEFLDWLRDESVLKVGIDEALLTTEKSGWLIERVSFKQFAVQFELQTPVEVAINLHDRLSEKINKIRYIEIKVKPATIKRIADPAKFAPKNRETADHSLPICVAMALLDGRLTPAQFHDDRWNTPDVLALAAKTTVTPEQSYDERYPGGRAVEISLQFEDGETVTDFLERPLGDAKRPMDDAAVERKFMDNAAAVLGAGRAKEIIDCVKRIDEVNDVRELTRLLMKP
jgi:2-methylcitrate dehydratase